MRDLCLSAGDQRNVSSMNRTWTYSSSAWRDVKRLLIVAVIASAPCTPQAWCSLLNLSFLPAGGTLEGRSISGFGEISAQGVGGDLRLICAEANSW